MIGARWLAGTSTSRHGMARRRRSVARPPAARTLRTQLHCSPSIGTRYHWPFESAIPSGKRTIRPERRPTTSRITHRFGSSPNTMTLAQNRARRRAVGLARLPTYMARAASAEIRATRLCLPRIAPNRNTELR